MSFSKEFDRYPNKRDYTIDRGTLIVIGISPYWLKSLPFIIVIGWDPWLKKRVKYLNGIEGIGEGFRTFIAQNAALFVDLL